MSIKFFCDECGKEVSLDESPEKIEHSGFDWTEWQHKECLEGSIYNSTTDERVSSHTCNDCVEKEVRDEC